MVSNVFGSQQVIPLSPNASSCGYLTGSHSPTPNWQKASNGQLMSAANCNFIGTDPIEIGISSLRTLKPELDTSTLADCASLCLKTSNCTHYRWANGWCFIMSLIKPVGYYSVTGNCGYVANRKFTTWKTNGLAKFAPKCGYRPSNEFPPSVSHKTANINQCTQFCINDSDCRFFSLSGGSCKLFDDNLPPVISTKTTDYCGYIPNRVN